MTDYSSDVSTAIAADKKVYDDFSPELAALLAWAKRSSGDPVFDKIALPSDKEISAAVADKHAAPADPNAPPPVAFQPGDVFKDGSIWRDGVKIT